MEGLGERGEGEKGGWECEFEPAASPSAQQPRAGGEGRAQQPGWMERRREWCPLSHITFEAARQGRCAAPEESGGARVGRRRRRRRGEGPRISFQFHFTIH